MSEFNKARRRMKRFFSGIMPGNNKGGIAITFDDAFVDEWCSLKGLFDAYGARATFFVSQFDKLTKNSIEKLGAIQDGGHEIGYHGLRHLNAVRFAEEKSVDEYVAAEIRPGIKMMAGYGFAATSFSYPYGSRSPQTDAALLKYFRYVRGTAFTDNKKRIVDLDQIYYRNGGKRVIHGAGMDNFYNNSIGEIQEGIRRADEMKEIIVLYAHKPANDSRDYSVPLEKLEAVIQYASERGMTFCRISDLNGEAEKQ